MILIPQIYLKNGQAARLENTTMALFSDDAFAMARMMVEAGCEALHITDLNIAPVGISGNVAVIKKIKSDLKIKVYVGGAFRAPPSIDPYVELGADLVMLDTHAYQQPRLVDEACKQHSGLIAVHIDVRDDRVTIPGWTVAANKTAFDYAERFLAQGVAAFVYSNTSSDGRMTDHNFGEILTFCKRVRMPVLCSSEIAGLGDIEHLVTLGAPHLEGLILGKSLYQGRIDLKGANAYIADMMLDSSNEPTLADG